MGLFLKFKEKKKIDETDGLCCWCYEISTDSENGLGKGLFIGLDFSPDIEIQNPENYVECNDYTRQKVKRKLPGGAEYEKWIVGTKEKTPQDEPVKKIDICFIAPCQEDYGTKISVEYKRDDQIWKKFKDFELIGPSATASIKFPGNEETIVALARYEGLKLSSLLSTVTFPKRNVGLTLDNLSEFENEIELLESEDSDDLTERDN